MSIPMHPDALTFLAQNRVCVFAVEMMDGSPHGSAVHFASFGDTPILVFLTERRYRKAEPLFGRPVTRASVVVGVSEGAMQTLQIDGRAELLVEGDEDLQEAYFAKFPEKRKKFNPPEDFFIKCTPIWWRYTDWGKPEGKTIFLSDGSVSIGK